MLMSPSSPYRTTYTLQLTKEMVSTSEEADLFSQTHTRTGREGSSSTHGTLTLVKVKDWPISCLLLLTINWPISWLEPPQGPLRQPEGPRESSACCHMGPTAGWPPWILKKLELSFLLTNSFGLFGGGGGGIRSQRQTTWGES